MDNQLHTLHWFEFAEDDLDSAKILAEHGSRKISAVCFHSHQSAEKNLKGYLVRLIRAMRTFVLVSGSVIHTLA
jgi:HEPN domain-containing protein